MSGLAGTQLDKDYIEIGGVKLPVPRHPYGEQDEWLAMRTTPLEPFQASVVLGDDSLVSEDRVATGVFSDVKPGIGNRRWQEVESVSGIQDGDLVTVEGLVHLPPYRNAVTGTLIATTADPTNKVVVGYMFTLGQRYQFALWGPTIGAGGNTMYIYDSVTTSFVVPVGPAFSWAPPHTAFGKIGQYWVMCGHGQIWYTTDGLNYTQGWSPADTHFEGMIRHDGKIYVLVRNTLTNLCQFYWASSEAQITGGVGVPWPASGVTFQLSTTENVINLVEWTDKITGDKMIYAATTRRLIGYNDGDFWVDYWAVPYPFDAYRPFACVNPRDGLLYMCFGGQNDSVFVFNHQQQDEVGPNKNFGIMRGGNDSFTIYTLQANSRHMFALGLGAQGRVLVANDAFGWSPFVRARLADPTDLTSLPSPANEKITGCLYGEGRLYIVMAGGKVEYLDWPDWAASVYNFPTTGVTARAYETGPFWNYSPEFDAGQELLYKLTKWWRFHLEKVNGSYSLPTVDANSRFYFKYQIDGGAWSATTTLTTVDTFPYVLALPSLVVQTGQAFRKLRFAYGLRGPATIARETPILRSVQLAFTREPDIYDGLQVTVDLTDERWTDGNGKVIGHFYGRDRRSLRTFLETLKSGPAQAKQHYKVVLGGAYEQKTYQSMDVRVSAVEDPQDRYGRYTLTLRDLTAPASG
jgi:hypothetical protein